MRYNPALDGIRAVAITMVLVRHANVPDLRGGFLGVDVFFVLSGYLITSILLEELRVKGKISLGDFYLRRLKRLYPPMLALLVAYVACVPWLWPKLEAPIRHALAAAVYMIDYAYVLDLKVGKLRYLWSLGVEEKFYLLWPLALPLIMKRGRPFLWMMGLVALCTSWRFLGQINGFSFNRLYFCFDTHASGLMMGCTMAWLLARFPARVPPWVGLAALFLIVAVAHAFPWGSGESILWGMLASEIATILLILSAQSADGWLAWKPLVLIGKYSYGLYLWHMPIMLWLRERYEWPTTLLVGCSFGLLASMLSYHTVEAYFRNRKKPRTDQELSKPATVEDHP